VNLGIVLQKQGKLSEAMAHYSEALRVDPNHAGAHYDLATALSSLGRTDEALAQYDEAVRLDAKFAQAEWAKEFEALRRGKGR